MISTSRAHEELIFFGRIIFLFSPTWYTIIGPPFIPITRNASDIWSNKEEIKWLNHLSKSLWLYLPLIETLFLLKNLAQIDSNSNISAKKSMDTWKQKISFEMTLLPADIVLQILYRLIYNAEKVSLLLYTLIMIEHVFFVFFFVKWCVKRRNFHGSEVKRREQLYFHWIVSYGSNNCE